MPSSAGGEKGDEVSQLLRDLVEEINRFRADPRGYSEEMANNLQGAYNGNIITYPESGLELETLEGGAALQDCLDDLNNATPLPAMSSSYAISDACQQHLDDLSRNDFCSHIGTDCSTPEERLARFGEHREQCGENIVFGMRVAKEVVYHMLIDDGSPDRGHRANLLNMDFHFVGLAHGSHPSAETVTVALFVDHFRARRQGKMEQMKNVAEVFSGKMPDSGIHKVASTQMHWDNLMEDIKPNHLKVPGYNKEGVRRVDNPRLYGKPAAVAPRIPVGRLAPKPRLDPVIVRSFVHRYDADHDDGVEEHELVALACQNEMTFNDLQYMYDEILERRPWLYRQNRMINWKEIFAAVRPLKEWVPAFDIFVQRDSDRYQLVVDVGETEQWCKQVVEELGPRLDVDLSALFAECFGDRTDATMAGSRNRAGAVRIKKLSQFLAAVLGASFTDTGRPAESHSLVQAFFAPPEAGKVAGPAPGIQVAQCMGRRTCWAFTLRPHSDKWMKLINAAGLKAQVPTPHVQTYRDKPLISHMEMSMTSAAGRNFSSTAAKTMDSTNAAGLGDKGSATLSGKTMGRGGGADRTTLNLLSPKKDPRVEDLMTLVRQREEATKSMDEHQQQAEALVNRCLLGEDQPPTLSQSAPLTCTFAARQRFEQVLSKQQRANEEQRYVSNMNRTRSKSATDSSYMLGTKTRPLPKRRGAGAPSVDHAHGVRGHFHNSCAIHSETAARGFSQPNGTRLDGEHIDHSLAPPMKEDPKFSKMAKEERDRQFSCFFGKGNKHNMGTMALKCKASADQKDHIGEYKGWACAEFREDVPARHGNFGRRKFDAQVREKPVDNPHFVSDIEKLPMEQFLRQQDRVHDFLDRSMPTGQQRHFQTHLPRSEMPTKYMEMANRELMLSEADGVLKVPELGFGQNRHSGPLDMNLYSRPLGASQMDRLIPLA